MLPKTKQIKNFVTYYCQQYRNLAVGVSLMLVSSIAFANGSENHRVKSLGSSSDNDDSMSKYVVRLEGLSIKADERDPSVLFLNSRQSIKPKMMEIRPTDFSRKSHSAPLLIRDLNRIN